MKVFEAKEGKEDTFVKCFLGWFRAAGRGTVRRLQERLFN